MDFELQTPPPDIALGAALLGWALRERHARPSEPPPPPPFEDEEPTWPLSANRLP